MRHRHFEDPRAEHRGLDYHLHGPPESAVLHVEAPQQVHADGA